MNIGTVEQRYIDRERKQIHFRERILARTSSRTENVRIKTSRINQKRSSDLLISSRKYKNKEFKLKNKSEIIFAATVFFILLCKLFVRVSIIETSYRIENTRRELLAEDANLREIKVKKAMIASPRELSVIAGNKLDMRQTLPQQIRRVRIN